MHGKMCIVVGMKAIMILNSISTQRCFPENHGFSDKSFQQWHSTLFDTVSQAEAAVTKVSAGKNGLDN